MVISMIAALAENRAIGMKGKLPWRLADDLKHFKELTTGKPVIMGRGTYEAIGRLLPNRTNIIMTNRPNFRVHGAVIAHSVEDALGRAAETEADEVMIIGGQQIYQVFLPKADRLYLTEVRTTVDGDAFFPEFDMSEWREADRQKHAADDRNEHAFSFVTLQRN